jgi:hypothetical protein
LALTLAFSCLRSTSRVNWSLIQPWLLDCASDVLFLFDTCFAGKAAKSTSGSASGSKEVISACNDSSLAPGVGRFSFTRVLIRVLKNFAEKHRVCNESLTAATLAAHLVNHYYGPELKRLPQYASLVEYQSDSCFILPTAGSPNRFLGSMSCLPQEDLGPLTVLVSIDLFDSPPGDLQNLISWLQGRGLPSRYLDGIGSIQVESIKGLDAVYTGHSTLLLLRVPLVVWYCLPPNIACRYVGLLRSENLIPRTTSRISEVGLPHIGSNSLQNEMEPSPVTDPEPSRPRFVGQPPNSSSNSSISLPITTGLGVTPGGRMTLRKGHPLQSCYYCDCCNNGPMLLTNNPACSSCGHIACPSCTYKEVWYDDDDVCEPTITPWRQK